MRVYLLSDRVGGGRIHHAGDTIDLPMGEALAAIEAGYAARVDDVETAAVTPVENAAQGVPPKRRKKASRRPSQ